MINRVLAGVLLMYLSALAQPTLAAFAFKNQLIDVGEIEAGVAVEVSFPFENTSNEPLQVLGVTTSCTCLEVTSAATTIPPAGQSELKARLRPGFSPGAFRHRITVNSHHPTTPYLQLHVAGVVLTDLIIQPRRLSLDLTSKPAETSTTLQVRARGQQALSLVNVRIFPEFFNVSVQRDHESAFRLTLSLPGNATPPAGDFRGYLTFDTNLAKMRTATVNFSVKGAPAWRIQPLPVIIAEPANPPLSIQVEVAAAGAFEIVSQTSSLDFIQIDLSDNQPNKKTLMLQIDQAKTPLSFQGFIMLQTANAGAIRIPIYSDSPAPSP